MLHGRQPHVAPKLRNLPAAAAGGPVKAPLILTVWPAQSGPGCRVRHRSRAARTNDPMTIRASGSVCRRSGPRSLARMGRRFAALFVDWLIAYGLAALAMSFGLVSMATLSTAVLVIWFVLGAVSVRLFGFTPGQFALGLMVVPVDGRQHVGIRPGRGARSADRGGHPAADHRRRPAGTAGQGDVYRGRAALVSACGRCAARCASWPASAAGPWASRRVRPWCPARPAATPASPSA